MIGAHRLTMALAVVVAANLMGCSAAPTSPDSPLGPASMREPARPDHQQIIRAPAHLVACSWSASAIATATIDEQGGSIVLAGHEISIPAGAVQKPTVFTANVPAGSRIALHLSSAEGTSLTIPARATISYARCDRQDLEHRSVRIVALPDTRGMSLVTEGLPEVPSTTHRFAEVVEFLVVQMGTYAVAF